jgi:hypothetical protein
MQLNIPNYSYRDHRNDLPKTNIENNFYSVSKRIATTVLPFLGLYKPFGKIFTIGTSALRGAKNCQQLIFSLDSNDLHSVAKSVLDVSLTVASIAGTIFLQPLGMVITTSHDLLLNCIRVVEIINKRDKSQLFEEILSVGSNSFYLLTMIYGSLQFQIATTVFQIFLNSYSSISNFKKGNYIETTGSILMTALKTDQLTKQIATFQKQAQFKRILKEIKCESANKELSCVNSTEKMPSLSEALLNGNEELALKILEIFPEQALEIISKPIYGKYKARDKEEFQFGLINIRPLYYALTNKYEKVSSKILDIQIDALKYAKQDELKARVTFCPSIGYDFYFNGDYSDNVEGYEHKILYSCYKKGVSAPTMSNPTTTNYDNYHTKGMVLVGVENKCSDDILNKIIYYQMLHHTLFRKEQPLISSYKDVPSDITEIFRKYYEPHSNMPLTVALYNKDLECFKNLVRWGVNTAVSFGDTYSFISIIDFYRSIDILLLSNNSYAKQFEAEKYLDFLLDNKYPIPNFFLYEKGRLYTGLPTNKVNYKDGSINEKYKFKLSPGTKGYIEEQLKKKFS